MSLPCRAPWEKTDRVVSSTFTVPTTNTLRGSGMRGSLLSASVLAILASANVRQLSIARLNPQQEKS